MVLDTILIIPLITSFTFLLITQISFQKEVSFSHIGCRGCVLKLLAPHHILYVSMCILFIRWYLLAFSTLTIGISFFTTDSSHDTNCLFQEACWKKVTRAFRQNTLSKLHSL